MSKRAGIIEVLRGAASWRGQSIYLAASVSGTVLSHDQ